MRKKIKKEKKQGTSEWSVEPASNEEGQGFDPGPGNWIPHAAQQKKRQKQTKKKEMRRRTGRGENEPSTSQNICPATARHQGCASCCTEERGSMVNSYSKDLLGAGRIWEFIYVRSDLAWDRFVPETELQQQLILSREACCFLPYEFRKFLWWVLMRLANIYKQYKPTWVTCRSPSSRILYKQGPLAWDSPSSHLVESA